MIEAGYLWTVIAILAGGTIAIRFSVIAVAHKISITERHRELFTYIPAAIFPALVVPMTFFHEGHVPWLFEKERFFILLFATIFCFAVRSMFATVVFGLVLLYAVTQL